MAGKFACVLACVLLIISYGCGDNSQKREKTDEPRLLKVDLEHQNVKLDDVFERIELIPLETNDSCLIKSVGRVIEYDSMIYMFNVSKVLRFRLDGSYVNSIGRRGRGPGEYIYVEDFEIDTATGDVFILSPFGYVFQYDSNGSFIEKYSPIHLPNYQNIRLCGDSCWFTWSNLFWGSDDSPVSFFTRDFSSVVAAPRVSLHGADMSWCSVALSQSNGRLHAAFVFGADIYEIRPDTVIKKFRWDFGDLMTKEETLEKYDLLPDTDPMVNARRADDFFADLGIRYYQNDQYVTDRYIYERLLINLDYDKKNPPHDLELPSYQILYDLKEDKPYVFESLGDSLLLGFVRGMTDDYLLEVVEPERFKFYKDYLPEGMSLEDIDVEEANPMLAKFYFKRK